MLQTVSHAQVKAHVSCHHCLSQSHPLIPIMAFKQHDLSRHAIGQRRPWSGGGGGIFLYTFHAFLLYRCGARDISGMYFTASCLKRRHCHFFESSYPKQFLKAAGRIWSGAGLHVIPWISQITGLRYCMNRAAPRFSPSEAYSKGNEAQLLASALVDFVSSFFFFSSSALLAASFASFSSYTMVISHIGEALIEHT